MLLGTGWIVTALVAGALAATAVHPVGVRSRHRERPRGGRMLRRRSDRVTLRHVERLLRTAGVAPATAARVVRRAEARGYGARTLWRWATIHGCDRLVLVVDAGVGEAALAEHLRAGTEPDWRTLAMFAELAGHDAPGGMPEDELLDLDGAPGPADLTFPVGLQDWSVEAAGPADDPFGDVLDDLFVRLFADPDGLDEGDPDGPARRRFTA